jgi:hypothetical protein
VTTIITLRRLARELWYWLGLALRVAAAYLMMVGLGWWMGAAEPNWAGLWMLVLPTAAVLLIAVVEDVVELRRRRQLRPRIGRGSWRIGRARISPRMD